MATPALTVAQWLRSSSSCNAASWRRDELVDRDVGVGEAPVVGGDALGYESADRVVDVPYVDIHACDDAIAADPEGDQLARRGIPAKDDPVLVAREAGVLHPDVVGMLTLVYSAHDTEHNDAVVLAEILRRGIPKSP
jgi:hypothetical protein